MKKKILKWVGIGVVAFVALGIIAVATDNGEANATSEEQTEEGAVKELAYRIAKEEPSSRQLTYRIEIDERASKARLIELTRKLKEKTGWKDELVCFFYIKSFSESGAWAATSYLPRCEECGTDKDADGNPIQYRMMGVSASLADSLQQLSYDSIPDKQLLASFIEDISKCRTVLYKVNDQPSKLLFVQVYTTGNLVKWLTQKKVGGENRYYFEDDEPAEANYLVIDEAAQTVRYKDYQDKQWMAYGYEAK